MCSVVGYYKFLLLDLSRMLIECSVNGFYSFIIINCGTAYNLTNRPSMCSDLYKPLKNKQLN